MTRERAVLEENTRQYEGCWLRKITLLHHNSYNRDMSRGIVTYVKEDVPLRICAHDAGLVKGRQTSQYLRVWVKYNKAVYSEKIDLVKVTPSAPVSEITLSTTPLGKNQSLAVSHSQLAWISLDLQSSATTENVVRFYCEYLESPWMMLSNLPFFGW